VRWETAWASAGRRDLLEFTLHGFPPGSSGRRINPGTLPSSRKDGWRPHGSVFPAQRFLQSGADVIPGGPGYRRQSEVGWSVDRGRVVNQRPLRIDDKTYAAWFLAPYRWPDRSGGVEQHGNSARLFIFPQIVILFRGGSRSPGVPGADEITESHTTPFGPSIPFAGAAYCRFHNACAYKGSPDCAIRAPRICPCNRKGAGPCRGCRLAVKSGAGFTDTSRKRRCHQDEDHSEMQVSVFLMGRLLWGGSYILYPGSRFLEAGTPKPGGRGESYLPTLIVIPTSFAPPLAP